MKRFNSVAAFAAALALLPFSAMALEMNEEQFIEYSAKQHCLNQDLWDQPEQLESELVGLEKSYGITEEDLDALDALTAKYGADAAIQEKIEEQARALCP